MFTSLVCVMLRAKIRTRATTVLDFSFRFLPYSTVYFIFLIFILIILLNIFLFYKIHSDLGNRWFQINKLYPSAHHFACAFYQHSGRYPLMSSVNIYSISCKQFSNILNSISFIEFGSRFSVYLTIYNR